MDELLADAAEALFALEDAVICCRNKRLRDNG